MLHSVWKLCVACIWTTLIYDASATQTSKRFSSKDVDIRKVYEPSPPVTHRVFFSIEYVMPGTDVQKTADVAIELYGTVVPDTVANFARLASGIKVVMQGQDKDKAMDVSYNGHPFYKIIANSRMETGTVLPHIGPFSTNGENWPDENFFLKHDRPGRLSMVNKGPNTQNSEFMIDTKVDGCPEFNDKNVVFGQVTKGLGALIDEVQYVDVDSEGKPKHDVTVRYMFVDELKLATLEAQHTDYLQKLESFRNGEISLGTTLKSAVEPAGGIKGKTRLDPSTMRSAYGNVGPEDSSSFSAGWALTLVGIALVVAIGMKYKSRFIDRANRVVSMRQV